MLRLRCGFVICVCVCRLAGFALGGEAAAPPNLDDVAKENARLKQEVQDLRKLLEDHLKPKDQPGLPPADEKLPPDKFPILTSLKMELYGYIKVDASYDTAHVRTGNYAIYVDSEQANKHDNEFNLTANETRLGLNITGPQMGDAVASGKIEFDFYSAAPENKSIPMLRHAYAKVDWSDYELSILAGQTSDVISPLNMPTLNYTVGWESGNIGYRHPQVRVTQGVEVNESSKLVFEGAVSRTIGTGPAAGTGSKESGEDAGFPTIQGRTSLRFPLLTAKPTIVGVSGHWGQEEYDTNAMGSTHRITSWSGNVDLTMPVTPLLGVKGECYKGSDLATFMGGIGQGINARMGRGIDAQGAWIAASVTPPGPWEFNVGAGYESDEKADLTGYAAAQADVDALRTENNSVFANAIYNFSKAVSVGLEVSRWCTDYYALEPGEAYRVQTAFRYKF